MTWTSFSRGDRVSGVRDDWVGTVWKGRGDSLGERGVYPVFTRTKSQKRDRHGRWVLWWVGGPTEGVSGPRHKVSGEGSRRD